MLEEAITRQWERREANGDILAQIHMGHSEDEHAEMCDTVYLRQSYLAKLPYSEAIVTGLVDVHFNAEVINNEDDGTMVRA